MQRGAIKRFGSLRRRLDRAGLAVLHIKRRPARVAHVPANRQRLIPFGAILLLVLLVAMYSAAVQTGISSLPLMPNQSTRPARIAKPPGIARVVHRSMPGVATAQNIEDLAQILMSEASPGIANAAEMVAVGHTVLNRMRVSGLRTVRDVWDGYAHHATPTAELRMLAEQVLRGDIPDTTHGATHFYSPRSMPMEGDALQGFDTGGGLEQTLGLTSKNYRPGWAAQYDIVVVAGTRASHYKFYRQPDAAIHE